MVVDSVYARNNIRREEKSKTEEEKNSTMSECKGKRGDNETTVEAEGEDGMPPSTGRIKMP